MLMSRTSEGGGTKIFNIVHIKKYGIVNNAIQARVILPNTLLKPAKRHEIQKCLNYLISLLPHVQKV